MKKDRLFVPLMAEAFSDFKRREKVYEVRANQRGYTDRYVYSGRQVELRKGYSGESLLGIVGEVYTGTLEEIFGQIDFRLVEPRAESLEAAIRENMDILGDAPKYMVFQVLLGSSQR